MMTHPGAHNILFEMVFSELQMLYIPFLILSIAATVIASQAMISGIFSIVYQGITTRIMPLLRIEYTSPHLRSQIYIDIVNWLLLFAVLMVIAVFRTSNNLTHAYGLAVSGTMAITGIMIIWIFVLRGEIVKSFIAAGVLVITFVFLIVELPEDPVRGLLVARHRVHPVLHHPDLRQRPEETRICPAAGPAGRVPAEVQRSLPFRQPDQRDPPSSLPGTSASLPQYIPRIMFTNNIVYDDNIIISIIRTEQPFGVTWGVTREITPGLSIFEIYLGYMEIVDIGKILKEAEIDEKTIFYGMEDIVTTHIVWRIFAAIKRLSPSVVQFYKLPSDKIHGVVTRVDM